MTASQKAKQKCATKQNKPATNSEAANCCCMVAPWEIHEQDREYTLKVTEVGKEKQPDGTELDVSKELEYSNKKDKKFELHIVAPPADKNGKVTYKKITSGHEFLRKECDLRMLVKSDTQEKSIPKGGSFQIDTNGNMKGAMEKNCEEKDKQKPVVTSTPTSQRPVGRNACIAGPQRHNRSSTLHNMDISTLHDRYGSGSQKDMTKAEREDLAKEIDTYLKSLETEEIEASEEKTDMEIVLGALFNPQNIAKKIELKPTGSNKCVREPKVHLFVYPYTKADGAFSFMYTKSNKTIVPDYKGKIEINRAKIVVGGALTMYYGDRIIQLGASTEVGGGSYVRKRKRQLGERRAGKNIFTMMERTLNVFKKAEDAQLKRNREVGIHKSRKHQTFTFDPGKTGFSVAIKKHELKEIFKKYSIDYTADITLNINILNGVSITVDCIELLILASRSLNPAIGNILSKARDKGEKGFGWKKVNAKVGANVELSINGGIAAGLAWKKELEKDIKISKAKLSGTIGLSAKANIYAEAKFFFVSVSGYMGAIASSAIKTTTPSQLVLKGQIKSENNHILLGGGADFTGLALYYVYGGSVSTEDKASSKGNGDGVLGALSGGHKETIAKDIYDKNPPIIIAEPWPTEEKDSFINMEQFLD